MFEEYLADTADLISRARLAAKDGDSACAKRFYRSAAMVGVASLETFVNYIASTFEKAGPNGLAIYELAFLLDKRFNQDDGKFAMRDQPQYARLEDKLRFLVLRFSVDVDLGKSAEWSNFMRLKQLRDSLVHSRQEEDERPVDEYDTTCADGLKGCVGLMDHLSRGIFKKPLRAKLTDLAGR